MVILLIGRRSGLSEISAEPTWPDFILTCHILISVAIDYSWLPEDTVACRFVGFATHRQLVTTQIYEWAWSWWP